MIARTDLNTLPVDKGWAWAIAAAGFISSAVMTAGIQVRALLFLETLQMFNASITIGSLGFMFSALVSSLASVFITNYVMPKLTERGCLLVGGISSFVLNLGASFAPNIEVFIVILSVQGIVTGFIFVPGMSLIPQYFKRYRSRAAIVTFCGGSVVNIISPFIIRAARDEYGIMGVYFLLSAVQLHYCVAGLLLRPVRAYRFRSDDDTKTGDDTSTCKPRVPGNSDTNTHDVIADAAAKKSSENRMQGTHLELIDDAKDAETLVIQDVVDEGLHDKVVANTDQMGVGTRTGEHGSDRTLDGDTRIEHKIEDVTDTAVNNSLTRWQTFYQGSSLERWALRCFVVSAVPGSAVVYLISYLPTICKFQGVSFDQAASLTTIMGAVDLVSRIATGFVADTKVLPSSMLSAITQVCLGIGCHFLRFATTFETLIPVIIVIGIFLATRGPIQTLVCVEVVGTKKYPQAFSLYLLVLTFSSSLFNPSLGALVEATGSFVPVLHILGTCIFICAGLIACLPFVERLDVKGGRKT